MEDTCSEAHARPVFRGVWPVAITPFRPDGAIDEAASCELIDWYVEKGVHGLFVNCYASEMSELTPEERLAITRSAVECAAGRIGVVSTGSFGETLDEHAEFAKRVAGCGVDAVILTPPAFCRDDDDDLLSYFLEMAARVPCMLGIYECPTPSPKKLLPVAMVAQLAESGRYGPFKETSCDIDTIRRKVEVSAGSPLAVLQASSPLLPDAMAAGTPGFMGPGATVAPELAVRIVRNVEAGVDVGRDHQLLCLTNSLITHGYWPAMKFILGMRGLSLGYTCRAESTGAFESYQLIVEKGWALLEDEIVRS